MTKTELQTALAIATNTDKRTAGVFLKTLTSLAYREIKKNGEFVLPGFGKLVKQKRKARMGINPKTQQKIKIPAKTVVKFRVAKAAKDAVLGAKKESGFRGSAAVRRVADKLPGNRCSRSRPASRQPVSQFGRAVEPTGAHPLGNSDIVRNDLMKPGQSCECCLAREGKI